MDVLRSLTMSFEPLQESLCVKGLLVKGIFIAGKIGKDFDSINNLHRAAQKEARYFYHPRPEPDAIQILKVVEVPELGGYLIALTDGASKRYGK